MPIPADDDPAMVEGWKALLRMQERAATNARRQALEMIGRPIRRAARPDQEEKTDD
jgi:hypothetical protein